MDVLIGTRDLKAAVTNADKYQRSSICLRLFACKQDISKLFADYPEILCANRIWIKEMLWTDIDDGSGTVGKKWLNFEGEQYREGEDASC